MLFLLNQKVRLSYNAFPLKSAETVKTLMSSPGTHTMVMMLLSFIKVYSSDACKSFNHSKTLQLIILFTAM